MNQVKRLIFGALVVSGLLVSYNSCMEMQADDYELLAEKKRRSIFNNQNVLLVTLQKTTKNRKNAGLSNRPKNASALVAAAHGALPWYEH